MCLQHTSVAIPTGPYFRYLWKKGEATYLRRPPSESTWVHPTVTWDLTWLSAQLGKAAGRASPQSIRKDPVSNHCVHGPMREFWGLRSANRDKQCGSRGGFGTTEGSSFPLSCTGTSPDDDCSWPVPVLLRLLPSTPQQWQTPLCCLGE